MFTNAGLMLDHRLRPWPSNSPTLGQRLLLDEIIINYTRPKKSCSDVVLILGQRRRRWTNIKATLGQPLLLAWITSDSS